MLQRALPPENPSIPINLLAGELLKENIAKCIYVNASNQLDGWLGLFGDFHNIAFPIIGTSRRTMWIPIRWVTIVELFAWIKKASNSSWALHVTSCFKALSEVTECLFYCEHWSVSALKMMKRTNVFYLKSDWNWSGTFAFRHFCKPVFVNLGLLFSG